MFRTDTDLTPVVVALSLLTRYSWRVDQESGDEARKIVVEARSALEKIRQRLEKDSTYE